MATTTRALGTRLQKLESALGTADAPPKVMRLVVCDLGRTLNLERSHCTRTLEDRRLVELVNLHGDRSQLSDDEFERFVASFPIVRQMEWSGAGARVRGKQESGSEAEKPAAAGAGRARREAVDVTG